MTGAGILALSITFPSVSRSLLPRVAFASFSSFLLSFSPFFLFYLSCFLSSFFFSFLFFSFLSFSVCVRVFFLCHLSFPNHSFGTDPGDIRACRGETWRDLTFLCVPRWRSESAAEGLKGRGCRGLRVWAWPSRGADKASVTITTVWRRPGVPTPRVGNGSLRDLIRRHSGFCVCVCAYSSGKEARTWTEAQPGSVDHHAGNSVGKLSRLRRPTSPGSGFNRDKGAPLGQRLAACLPVAYIRFRLCQIWHPCKDRCWRKEASGASPFQLIEERNSKFHNPWDTNLSPCSKL